MALAVNSQWKLISHFIWLFYGAFCPRITSVLACDVFCFPLTPTNSLISVLGKQILQRRLASLIVAFPMTSKKNHFRYVGYTPTWLWMSFCGHFNCPRIWTPLDLCLSSSMLTRWWMSICYIRMCECNKRGLEWGCRSWYVLRKQILAENSLNVHQEETAKCIMAHPHPGKCTCVRENNEAGLPVLMGNIFPDALLSSLWDLSLYHTSHESRWASVIKDFREGDIRYWRYCF